jgi:hypothetical protein
MQVLASAAERAIRVRRRAHNPLRAHGRDHNHHLADGGNIEFETLATPKARGLHHLDLGQLVVPAADTVDRLRAEQVAAPEFPNPEFCRSGNRTNLSTVALPPETAAKTERNPPRSMRTPGVPPLTPELGGVRARTKGGIRARTKGRIRARTKGGIRARTKGGIRAPTTILAGVHVGAVREHGTWRRDPWLPPRRPLCRRSGTKSPISRPRTELTAYAGIVASALAVALVLGAPWHSLALAGALLLACVPAGAAVMCWVDSGENGSQAGLTLTVSLAVVAIAYTLMIWTSFWQPRMVLFVLAFVGAASCAARLGWRANR